MWAVGNICKPLLQSAIRGNKCGQLRRDVEFGVIALAVYKFAGPCDRMRRYHCTLVNSSTASFPALERGASECAVVHAAIACRGWSSDRQIFP